MPVKLQGNLAVVRKVCHKLKVLQTVFLAPLLCVLFLTVLLTGCHFSKQESRIGQDPAIYSKAAYTPVTLDSVYIDQVLMADKVYLDFRNEIQDFYHRRAYQAAWFGEEGLSSSASVFYVALCNYAETFGDSAAIDPYLAEKFSPGGKDDLFAGKNPLEKPKLDLALTACFFRYAHRVYSGRASNLRDLEWYIPRRKKDYQHLLDTLINSPNSYGQYEPINPYYQTLKKALCKYRELETQGGFAQIQFSDLLKKGDSVDALAEVKKYLQFLGDYDKMDSNVLLTDSLSAAVMHFQQRMGLPLSGKMDSPTLAELSVPLADRVRQLMLNMERLRWMPDEMPDNYLLVNIPEFRLHVWQNGHYLWSMKVVVGKAATATSIFTARLTLADFCPFWKVPQSIIRRELLPVLKHRPSYLQELDMEVVAGNKVLNPAFVKWNRYENAVPFDIRQRPGVKNSLGRLAFFFPNNFDIFLHDTPSKGNFEDYTRAFSHGCIRLENAYKLASYIFRNDKQMTPEKIDQLMNSGREQKVSVKPPLQVYIVYFTAWVDGNGEVNFRHDVYGLDGKLEKEIFGK